MNTKDNGVELFLKFKKGDKDAFQRILEKYQNRVINIAYRLLRDREEAKDIAQEVFIRVYRAAGNYQPRAKLSTYLYRITTNLCLNQLRKAKHKTHISLSNPIEKVEDKAAKFADTASLTPPEILSQKEMKEAVRKAIDALPSKQRMAIILYEYEDLSYREIALSINCSVKAVERLLYRARETLKQNSTLRALY